MSTENPPTPPTPPTPPAAPTPPAPPAAPTPPAPAADDDSIKALVEARLAEALAKLKGTPAAPAAPAAEPAAAAPSAADIDAMIRTALEGRDREDAVAMLTEQLAEVRGQLDKVSKPARNWATMLLGQPFGRR